VVTAIATRRSIRPIVLTFTWSTIALVLMVVTADRHASSPCGPRRRLRLIGGVAMTPHAQLRRPPTAPGSICVCWVLCLLGAPVVGTRFAPFARRDGTARRTGQRQDVDRRGGREIGAERDGVQSRRQERRRGHGRLCQRHARHPESAPHRACAGGAFLHSLSGPGRDGGQGRHHGDSTRWLRTWIRPGRQATMRSCFTRLAKWRHWESTSRRHQRRVQPVRPRRLPLLRLRRHAGAQDHRRQRRSRCSRISRSIHT
jgi:hypothetical protein